MLEISTTALLLALVPIAEMFVLKLWPALNVLSVMLVIGGFGFRISSSTSYSVFSLPLVAINFTLPMPVVDFTLALKNTCCSPIEGKFIVCEVPPTGSIKGLVCKLSVTFLTLFCVAKIAD